MNVTTRNLKAKQYVDAQISKARQSTHSMFNSLEDKRNIDQLLTDLIEVNAKGFRGVVLTAIVGLHLDQKFDPLDNFYSCNPRSIFEKGIWYSLEENRIPCGKSDPLNVAKNIQKLDRAWAVGRRPQSSALAAVQFLRLLMSKEPKNRELVIEYFFRRLVLYSESITSIQIAEITGQGSPKLLQAEKLIRFTLCFPEAGAIPQLLVHYLLSVLYENSSIDVLGGLESVFGTNTTSKKPADIWTVRDNEICNLYEVTVKKVDAKRLDDCIHALASLDELSTPVTFICRIPEDISELDTYGGCLTYKKKQFEFVNIADLVRSTAALLTREQFSTIMNQMQGYVQDHRRPKHIKEGWNNIFLDEPTSLI